MNLTWVSALIVDPDPHSASILSGMLDGFGLQKKSVVASAAEAKSAVVNELFDIVLCDAELPDMPSVDLIRELRRMESNPIRCVPIIGIAGYAQHSIVTTLRDAGTNFVLSKPVSADVLYERLKWVAKGTRLFVESPNYVGPDRKFKNAGIPGGVGRRATDLNGAIGEAVEPNLSQEEIDQMVKPMKLDL